MSRVVCLKWICVYYLPTRNSHAIHTQFQSKSPCLTKTCVASRLRVMVLVRSFAPEIATNPGVANEP